MSFADGTTVGVDRSKAELERILARYGADQFMYGWDGRDAILMFRMNERSVKFNLIMPARDDEEFTQTPTGKDRTESQAFSAWEKETRRKWRCLVLVVKAKLEAVESGITIFDEEFLAHIVVDGNMTIGQKLVPQIQKAIDSGKMPKLLLGM